MARTIDSTKKPRVVLLDSHAIIHRAYHALPDFSSSKGEPTGALYGLSTMIMKIVNDLGPDYIIACFDLPEPTHRHEVYEAYKGTRIKTDDALVVQLQRARDVMTAFGIPIYDAPGFEADDVLGTIAHHLSDTHNVVIASGDMDTLQLVRDDTVTVYTLKKGINDTIMYNEDAVVARYGFAPQRVPDFKGLKGDPSDNIPGVPGVGETTAQKLVATYGDLDAIFAALDADVDAVHKKTGIQKRFLTKIIEGKEDAEFSKMLATIKTDVPIDFVLPTQSWKEGIDVPALKALFAELEFRSLGARVDELVNGKTHIHNSATDTAPPKKVEHTLEDADTTAETQLMLWLVRSDYTNPTLDDVFAHTKTHAVAQAHKVLEGEIQKHGLQDVYEHIEKPLRPIVEAMQHYGVLLDVAYLKKLSKTYHAELAAIEKRIFKHAGGQFNINSPKQLGDILFDTLAIVPAGVRTKKTATGQRSTKESELQKLVDAHPIVREVLAYRELAKLLSTYIDALPQLVGADGRLHARFVQTGTTTGRIASIDPNVQNIPIRSVQGARIREAFVAPAGSVLVSLDYSQIELRLAAIISGDQKLIDAFVAGEDIHTAVASAVFAVPHAEVTKDMRRRAKVINFGMLYGMGVNALKAALGEGTTQAEAREFYDHYFATYGTLARWLDATKAQAQREGFVTTLFGRKRFFSGITSHLPFIRAQAERMAINAPVQGTAADIIKRAMIDITAMVQSQHVEDRVHMVLQVHDELVFEIDESLVQSIVPRIATIMESALMGKETHGVPLVVDGAVGKNWGDMKAL
jgi:DNA polymerase-1